MDKILVIEDNEFVRESIVELLETQGYQVLTAVNGSIGLDLIFRDSPSLILCDIMMPVMDGLEVIQHIRKEASVSHIPFIFLSAKSQSEDLRKGMNLGADDYLSKPFKAEELFAAVRSRLRKHENEEKSLELKVKSKAPLSNTVFSRQLLSSLQYLVDEAQHGYDYYEECSKDELKQLIGTLAVSSRKIKRTTYNTILYQQLQLAQYDEAVREHFTIGGSNKLEKNVRQIAVSASEMYQRPHDLYFKDIDEEKIPIPITYFKTLVNEILDNAFKYSSFKSLVIIEGKVIGREYHFSVIDSGKGMKALQLAQVGKAPLMDSNRFSLGLFLVKSIMKLNQGALVINSTFGEGTMAKLKFKL